MAKQTKDFKDRFDHRAAKDLAAQVHAAWNDFDQKHFLKLATRNLANLEMTPRIRQFSDALAATLPPEKPTAIDILTSAASPPPWTAATT